jgi:hypothetical protein
VTKLDRTSRKRQADRRAQEIETNVLQALRERYYILHQITRPPDLRVVVDAPLASPNAAADLAPKLDGALRSFDRFRVGFGVGGAALGAGVGTLVLPGIGSVAGAMVGGLFAFAKTLGSLQRDFGAACDECIAGLERALADQLATAEAAVATALRWRGSPPSSRNPSRKSAPPSRVNARSSTTSKLSTSACKNTTLASPHSSGGLLTPPSAFVGERPGMLRR